MVSPELEEGSEAEEKLTKDSVQKSSNDGENPTEDANGDDESNTIVLSISTFILRHIGTISIGAAIVLVAINVIMFFVGVTTINDCPLQPTIPIYLAVGGGVGLLTKAAPFLVLRTNRSKLIKAIIYLLFAFEIFWFILGSYWVYSIYEPKYTSKTGEHCDRTAYLLAFCLITLVYVFLGIFIIVVPCCLICYALCGFLQG